MTAASGTQALRAAAASRPDLVLLDMMMPEGDGFDVLPMMRSCGTDMPVIFLTAAMLSVSVYWPGPGWR